MTENLDKPAGKNRRRGRKSKNATNLDVDGTVKDYKGHKTLLIKFDENNPTWYAYANSLADFDETVLPKKAQLVTPQLVTKYRALADLIYQNEVRIFNQSESRGRDDRWVETTMRKGTLKDRIAASSVAVSSNPVHKFYSIDGLMGMVGCSESGGKTNSRVAQLASEALEELFLQTFLPTDRQLVPMAQRPLYKYEASDKTLSPKVLLMWRFEDMLKEKFSLFIDKYMAATLQDALELHKIHCLRSAATILQTVPEGEAKILTLIVNKLGDPSKKTASAAGHELRRILMKHPSMDVVVAREVQQLVHRPHLSSRALYNCITFLNQLKLSKDMADSKDDSFSKDPLPSSLVKTYFRLFDFAVKKSYGGKDEEDGVKSRLLSALLTGVNRAHPYLPDKDQALEEHIDSIYRVVHTAGPSACTQALMLLFQLVVDSSGNSNTADFKSSEERKARSSRFYRALYATLSHPNMLASGKHLTLYFNLLFKAMKNDDDIVRIAAFLKKMLSTVMHSPASVVTAAIFIVSEIAKDKPTITNCIAKVVDGETSCLFLDASKREPSAAIVFHAESSNADSSRKPTSPPLWELCLLHHHFHPSVKNFVANVGNIEYDGDPLKDFALAPFLDKFSYRNPKSTKKLESHMKRGQSVAERRRGNEAIKRLHSSLPVNDRTFLEKDSVDAQDEFFLKFFKERARRDEIKGIKRHKELLDEDDIESRVDRALVAAETSEGIDATSKYEEYENAWVEDKEEEAFVDQLAESLMEDEVGRLDGEDPDTEGWDDMYSDDGAEKREREEHLSDESSGSSDEHHATKDDDDFMDESGDAEDSSSDIDIGAVLGGDGSDSSDDDDNDGDVFADAEAYASMIDKSWANRKRGARSVLDDALPIQQASNSKRKKRRR